MILYPVFYRKYGTRLLKDLVFPKVLDANTFEFPKDSMFYHFLVTDVPEYPSKDSFYFKKMKRVIIETHYEYTGQTEGSFVRLTANMPNNLISDMARKEKRLIFRKVNQTTVLMQPDTLYDHYYGCLNSFYRYNTNVMNKYYKYQNSIKTVVHDIVEGLSKEPDLKKARQRFLQIEIPDQLPTRMELDKYAKYMNSGYLKKLINYRYLNLLEFWKLFTPEYKENSAFNAIPVEYLHKIDIIFSIDNKLVVCNLGLLLSLVKPYNLNISSEDLKDEHDISLVSDSEVDVSTEELKIKQKFSPEMIRKLFYIFIYKIGDTRSKLVNVTVTMGATNIKVTKEKDDDTDIIDLDKVLANDVVEKQIEKKEVIAKNKKEDVEEDDDSDSLVKKLMEGDESDQIVMDYEDTLNFDSVDVSETLETKIGQKVFNDLNELYKDQDDYREKLEKEIELMKDTGLMSKTEALKYDIVIKNQKDLPDPYMAGKTGGKIVTLGETLDYSKDDLEIKPELAKIEDTPSVLDKSCNQNVNVAIKKDYLTNQYYKDLVRCIYAIQGKEVVIDSYQVAETNSLLGGLESHKIELKMLTGKKAKVEIILPKINPDGTFMVSNNTYVLRSLRAELMIRKINPNTVVLNTYYGKQFVKRAVYANADKGKEFFKRAMFLFQNTSDMSALSPSDLGPNASENINVELPPQYGYIARYLNSFTYKEYSFLFHYHKRESILREGDSLDKIEKKDMVLVGTKGKDYLLLDMKNNLYRYANGQYLPEKSILEILDLNEADMPVEYATIQLMKDNLPVVLLLGYYLGLENLFKLLKVNFKELKTNERTGELTAKQYVVKFKDTKLVIDKTDDYRDLIFTGLTAYSKLLPEINFKSLNHKEGYAVLFNIFNIKVHIQTEIKMLETLFVDPISYTVLKRMGEPTTFKALLIRACELIYQEKYSHANDVQGSVLKGYERIPGLVYQTLIKSLKDYESTTYFSKGKFVYQPYSVMKLLQEDSTNVLINDNNPMATVKQLEDTSFIGLGGRGSTLSMNRETRIMHDSEIGIISEAVKDNGDVGTTVYLTANPNIKDIRGVINTTDQKDLKWSSVLSTPAMLSPFITKDDAKRAVFASIMQSHIIPINEMRAPIIRTGYEAIVPLKSTEKFVVNAVEEGRVLSVTKSNMVVEYKTKGKKTYRLQPWTSKEESGACYTHYMIPNLVPGEKFRKDDTLVYDNFFFEPDIFDPHRVIYKQGTMINVAIMDTQQTFEDSVAISSKISKRLGTHVTKVRDFTLDCTKEIYNMIEEGTEVSPKTPLFTIGDAALKGQDISKDTLKILETIQRSAPKAKYKGKVSKVRIIYNCDPKDMSSSLRKLVAISDEHMEKEFGYTGRVTEAYSVKGKKLLNGTVEIKVYIQVDEDMSIGDKMILSNQLKCTVGEVFDYPITTSDGTEVEACFSYTGIAARIVVSAYLIGTTSTLMEKLQSNAVDMYFGNK